MHTAAICSYLLNTNQNLLTIFTVLQSLISNLTNSIAYVQVRHGSRSSTCAMSESFAAQDLPLAVTVEPQLIIITVQVAFIPL